MQAEIAARNIFLTLQQCAASPHLCSQAGSQLLLMPADIKRERAGRHELLLQVTVSPITQISRVASGRSVCEERMVLC